ncbi:MAG TPA: GNAT family N-acetyltransferase [Pyrinomonadaceae bacterium]
MNELDPQLTGYLHPAYAESLAEFGVPYELPGSRGWILKRQIPGCNKQDAIGSYPLFHCQDWSKLRADLNELSDELVSLSLVTFPFGSYDLAYLQSCFPDVLFPFKEHFVTDLSQPTEDLVHPHHQRNARRALRELNIETCENPSMFLDDWNALYQLLVHRHRITGISVFSEKSFRRQFEVPGFKAFRASRDGLTVGMLLWYLHGNVASYHLGAYSERGYELKASFGLFSRAVDYFKQSGLQWLHLGSAAGIGPVSESGLSRFKSGWATGSLTAYFCGRIFDQARYDELTRVTKLVEPTQYFPAYRAGEIVTSGTEENVSRVKATKRDITAC